MTSRESLAAPRGGSPSPHGDDSAAEAPARERSTPQKRALAAVLQDTPQFSSAKEVHARLRERGETVGLTTVYNQLRALAESGEIDSLRSDDGEALYRRCGSDQHHHHLLCRSCGRTVEIEGPEVERWAARVAAEQGFEAVSHVVEVQGLCPACSKPGT